MRVWKEQPFGRFTGDLRSVSVAVKVWDRATESYTWDLVQVQEISPDGTEFATVENEVFDVADIVKAFR